MSSRPRIGVYAIGKNEESFLRRMLDSVVEADVICYVDTGSTDGTISEFVKFACKHEERIRVISGMICVSPWRFDDARNFALAKLPLDVDVCISIDCDEYLENGSMEALREVIASGGVAARYHHRFSTIWDWRGENLNYTDHWHSRIHSRRGFRWVGPVHEELVYTGDETAIYCDSVKMIQKPDTTKTRAYGPLLELAVRENPKNWRLWTFLAQEQDAAGDLNAAYGSLAKAQYCPDADLGHIYLNLARYLERFGMRTDADEMYLKAIGQKPKLREYRVYYAEFLERCGDLSNARQQYRAAALLNTQATGYDFNPAHWSGAFETKLNSHVNP